MKEHSWLYGLRYSDYTTRSQDLELKPQQGSQMHLHWASHFAPSDVITFFIRNLLQDIAWVLPYVKCLDLCRECLRLRKIGLCKPFAYSGAIQGPLETEFSAGWLSTLCVRTERRLPMT